MKAIRFERFGDPLEVLSVVDLPKPEPGRGQVLVRMIASPVNPSDLLVTRGLYGVLPKLPAVPGFEGVGVVEAAGRGPIGRFLVGKRVAVINQRGGNWAEYATVPAIRAIPMPSDLPDEQIASFFVNPITALAMARHVLAVPKGAWLLQSAAGSTLGRMLIKLGKHDGFKTINVVRRREAMQELKNLGGDLVLSSSDGPIEEQVADLAKGATIKHAIDPVGGETGSGIFRSLGEGGKLLLYGSLTNEPLSIDSRFMIAGRRSIEGFWLGHWMTSRNKLASLRTFRRAVKLIRAGVLATEPGPKFGFDSIREAVAAAETPGRLGKVLLTP